MKKFTHKKNYFSFDQANGEAEMLTHTEGHEHNIKVHAVRNFITGEIKGHIYTIHHVRTK